MLVDIQDPIERFISFIEERECIRIRRESNKPYPWTQEIILQTYRFTNINRENDAVSKHYQHTIRNHYKEDPLVYPGTVLYRWFNINIYMRRHFSIGSDLNNMSTFGTYMTANRVIKGKTRKTRPTTLPTPHVTGAYIITGKPGYSKGEGVIQYFHQWCQLGWQTQWERWQELPPTLEQIYSEIESEGLGSFMKGQLIADLKYLPFLINAPDWWTWATRESSVSMKRLNIVLGRGMVFSPCEP